MAITITLPTSGHVGPGIEISWVSTYGGVVPAGAIWLGTFGGFTVVENYGGILTSQWTPACGGNANPGLSFEVEPTDSPVDGTAVTVTIELKASGGGAVLDSGSVAAVWNNTEGLWRQALFGFGGLGGLPNNVSAILSAVRHEQTAPGQNG